MELYYFYWQDRGGRVAWLLEELGVPYTARFLDASKGEHKSPAHLELHPLGKVPVLIDGDLTLFETGAIMCYLADKFAEKQLAPAVASDQRAHYLKWIFLVTATVEPFFHRLWAASGDAGRTSLEQEFQPMKACIAAALAEAEYLVEGRFTAADIMVGDVLRWAQSSELLSDEHDEVLRRYIARLWERPAFASVRQAGPQEIG